MRIALGLPSRVTSASGDMMLEWISRAEAGPFSSVAVTDRVVSQALEPLAVLAMAAGATKRIGLMTSVVIGPTRETTLLARQAATIDTLSGGRLITWRRHWRAQKRLSRQRHGLSPARPQLRETIRAAAQTLVRRGVIRRHRPHRTAGGTHWRTGAAHRRLRSGDRPTHRQWGDGYMAPGGGEPEALLKTWQNILQAWQEHERQGRPRWVGASYFALGPNAQDHAESLHKPQLRLQSRARRQTIAHSAGLPMKPCARRSSARPTWASTNSSCAPAPKIWTRWIGSPKSRRRSNDKIPSHHEGKNDTKVSHNLNSELRDLRVLRGESSGRIGTLLTYAGISIIFYQARQ